MATGVPVAALATGVPVAAFSSAEEELAVERLRKDWEHSDACALVPLDTLARTGWRTLAPDEWLKLPSNAFMLRRVLSTALGVSEADFVLRPDLTLAVRGVARRVPPPPRLVAAGQHTYRRQKENGFITRLSESDGFVQCANVTETSVIMLTCAIPGGLMSVEPMPGEGFRIKEILGEAASNDSSFCNRWGHCSPITVHWCVMEP
jgi:hypothetical protein